MKSSERAIYNTLIIYLKLIISIIIGLFTTRIVLNTLGEINYGIYTLVAGVIGMLAFFNMSLSITSLRFMSHSIGSNDIDRVKYTFNSTLIVHIVFGFILILFLEIFGYFFFKYWLDIPTGHVFDAKLIFQFMIITAFISVISVPFEAVMKAHENFIVISLIDILRVTLNLFIALSLKFFEYNVLIIYGFLMMLNQLLQRLIKQWYSRKKYEECKIKLRSFIDRNLIREIIQFSGWNVLTATSAIFVTQSRSVLLNMFFGVKLNAAQGIAQNLTNQLNHFSASLTNAIKPQIIKSEGSGSRSHMIYLTILSAKFSVLLFSLISIPAFIEMPFILLMWLKNVPDFSIVFARIIIISMFIEKFTTPLRTSIHAIGKLRGFTISIFILRFLLIPITVIFFRYDYPPQTIYIIALFLNIGIGIARIYYGWKIAGIKIANYVNNVIVKSLFPVLLAAILSLVPLYTLDPGIIRLAITTCFSMFVSIFLFGILGLDKDEFNKITSILKQNLKKLFNRT